MSTGEHFQPEARTPLFTLYLQGAYEWQADGNARNPLGSRNSSCDPPRSARVPAVTRERKAPPTPHDAASLALSDSRRPLFWMAGKPTSEARFGGRRPGSHPIQTTKVTAPPRDGRPGRGRPLESRRQENEREVGPIGAPDKNAASELPLAPTRDRSELRTVIWEPHFMRHTQPAPASREIFQQGTPPGGPMGCETESREVRRLHYPNSRAGTNHIPGCTARTSLSFCGRRERKQHPPTPLQG